MVEMGRYSSRGKLPPAQMLNIMGFSLLFFPSLAHAAAEGGEYLKYQEASQPSPFPAFLTTIAYILSLVVSFAIVIALAYFVSRLIGLKMGRLSRYGDNRVLSVLPLGPNKAIYVVEVAGRYFILGVTERNISVITEIVSQEEIDKIKNVRDLDQKPFDKIFREKMASLQRISGRFSSFSREPEKRSREDDHDFR